MYWLSIERYENWEVDMHNNFSFLGISSRKLNLAKEIKSGDQIITYVSSRYSSFAGIREVTSAVHTSRFGFLYDEPYQYQIDTHPLVILPKEKWIKIHTFVGQLSFLPAGKDWRNITRISLRKLNDNDAHVLLNSITEKGYSAAT